MASALEQAEKLIPAEVRMISGCRDSQTSADVSNVASFQLPDPAGRAGGACTSAMLKVLYADHHATNTDLSFQEVLLEMRKILSSGRYTQVPQLTSSRPLDVHHKFTILPDNFSGQRHALLIGINYVGQQGELSGCHNDVNNMIDYLKDVHGFDDSHIIVIMDDGKHKEPTRDNILAAYKQLVLDAKPGDAVFCHYSGHGGKLRDDDGDEKDGYDETLVPVDFQSAGQIRDDDLFSTLIAPMKKGVTMTCVMDCCHSGTVLDLPYVFVADGTEEEMHLAQDFNFGDLQQLFQAYMAAQQANGGDPVAALQKLCGPECNIL